MQREIYEFPVTIYGNFEKYNEVLSKARCRIFYKYKNRNGTYITDSFAEKLLSSIPYAPVKGIYSYGENDYEDHGNARDEGRIYGIVPENPNIAWEEHLDKDGIVRTYACADVLVFTALYGEASEIIGKSQSMELYGPSLKYHEAIIQGEKYIVFDDGCFLGLQVLGDKVEPCFEGASFYTLQNSIQYAIDQIRTYGGMKMPKVTFKLSDSQKFDAIFNLLNPEFNEEGNWTITWCITAVYDDYALAINYDKGEYARVYYTKDDTNDMVTLGEIVKCYVMDITESEKQTLDTLRILNGETYEKVSDVLASAQDNFDKAQQYSSQIEELNTTINTLQEAQNTYTTELEQYKTQINDVNASLASLQEENNSLKQYRANIEDAQKAEIIKEYTELLSEEILAKYTENIDKYGIDELDKELAYEVKKSNSSVFQKKDNEGYLPKDMNLEGISAILSKYKK